MRAMSTPPTRPIHGDGHGCVPTSPQPKLRPPYGGTACMEWEGNARRYQDAAARSIQLETGYETSQYAWITPKCGNGLCVEPSHLQVHAPARLAYPRLVCIYCGRHAGTKDHLFPRAWTGDTRRSFTVIVPACGLCNTLLSDTLTWSITERRAICHARIRRKFRRVLRYVKHTPAELDEYGDALRQYVVDGMEKRAEVERMLAWPESPDYDDRALQKSGIGDPYVLGLILATSDIELLVRAIA